MVPGFPVVIVLTITAAVLHASWNAIAHHVPDRLAGFALIGIAATVIGGVGVALTGPLPPRAFVLVLVSAALHVAYNLLLLASYQLGEFSQMYPLARGTSPWVVALVSVTVLGRSLSTAALLGVLVISAGLVALVFLGGRGRRGARGQLPALGAALATGLCIAAYTVVDGLGVGAAPVVAYAAWLFLLQGPVMPVIALARRGRALPGALAPIAGRGLTGGVVSVLAYGLVLLAQTSGALAPVAALRETSIVIGALIGAVFFGERFGRGRALAAAVVVGGVVLISLG